LIVTGGQTRALPIQTEGGSKPTRAKLVFVLYDALHGLADPSSDYGRIFQNILATLPRDRHDFVSAEIATFLQRVPTSEVDFKCGAEFMRYRARQELWRLKDVLLNMNPLPSEPQFCYAMPFAIDLTRPTDTVEIYGYDLDRAPLQMFLVNGDVFQDVSSAL